MDRERAIQALREHKDAWRYNDENKFVEVYPRPLVFMLDAVFEKLDELEEKIRNNRFGG
jgi:hypothetical protein